MALRLANDTATDRRHQAAVLLASCRRVPAARRRTLWLEQANHDAAIACAADDGSFIGWGVAIGAYPCFIAPALARLKVTVEGGVFISIGSHEMGQGIRTALAAAVSRKLGVPAANVVAVIGDTRASPQHMTAGSWGTASAIPAAIEAADCNARGSGETKPGRTLPVARRRKS